jgi:hypothetical protein
VTVEGVDEGMVPRLEHDGGASWQGCLHR